MAVEGLEELPALWPVRERYFRRHAQLWRANGPILEFPAPEWTGEWLDDPERLEVGMPLAVQRLLKHAHRHEWETRVRYARGNRQHSRTAKPLGLAHSLAVAMRHPGTPVRAVAVTFCPVRVSEWSWGTFLTSTDGALRPFTGYTQFAEYLTAVNSGLSVLVGGG